MISSELYRRGFVCQRFCRHRRPLLVLLRDRRAAAILRCNNRRRQGCALRGECRQVHGKSGEGFCVRGQTAYHRVIRCDELIVRIVVESHRYF